MTEERGEAVLTIPLSRIRPDPDQPRKFFDEKKVKKLADSIRKFVLLQPIMVRPVNHNLYDYIIVHGERRFRAHKQLGLETIKALLWEKGESSVRDLQLLENVQRMDLSDIELAWEFVTEVMGIPAESLWVTVFETDDEAEELKAYWKEYA